MAGRSPGGPSVTPQMTGATRKMTTHSGGQLVTPSRGGITQGVSTHSGGQPVTETCRGCTWSGKSLRGHLARTKSNCQDFYDMAVLEEEARKVKIKQRAQWEVDHRSDRSDRRLQQRNTSRADSPKKRAASKSLSMDSNSPDVQKESATNQKLEAHKDLGFV